MEVIRPLVHILGEESRSLRAKFTTFRHSSIKGLNSFTSSFHQVLQIASSESEIYLGNSAF